VLPGFERIGGQPPDAVLQMIADGRAGWVRSPVELTDAPGRPCG
jgi:hypothetical protein